MERGHGQYSKDRDYHTRFAGGQCRRKATATLGGRKSHADRCSGFDTWATRVTKAADALSMPRALSLFSFFLIQANSRVLQNPGETQHARVHAPMISPTTEQFP